MVYIVLLRGINVSGKNKIPMVELRELLNSLDFKNVQTYIQSGNIILESEETKETISKKVKQGIHEKYEYDVPVIVRTVSEWEKAIKGYPFSIENEKIVAFSFLNTVSNQIEIEVKGIKEDQYKIDKDVVYLHCPSGFGKTKLTNNILEKKLDVIATTRNYKTTVKLLEMATNE
ncbi:DUF1697 domain-containing protein [Tenacibaculum aiptasiae]|uniref:DUF1697 domain-containing protein n=1 Tax=Tenacibaculum aiptasiae TaxID=426481 RepID=UPI00232DE159|nr:DUF1697 domain-containing protein [Tenacibaculum aiptasiae]